MPATDLTLLIEAARAAGDIARKYFGADLQVWQKPGDAGPVTEADIAVNAMLHAELLSARADYGWLSEESVDDANRLDTQCQFVIDPIDGTRAFIQKSRDWALAVVESGSATAAVVYLPMRDELFAASLGQGASLNGAPIKVSSQVQLHGAKVLSPKPNLAPKNWKHGEAPSFDRHFRSSLAFRLCLVAQGRFDAMLMLRPTWEWDVVAGALIVTEAGGTVTDRKGNMPQFNNLHPQIDGIVAGGPIHSELQRKLA